MSMDVALSRAIFVEWFCVVTSGLYLECFSFSADIWLYLGFVPQALVRRNMENVEEARCVLPL